MSVARPCLASVGETVFPPRDPLLPEAASFGEPPGSPGTPPRSRATELPVSRTQVGIVGAGPAGLTLAHLLHREGIDSVVIEDRGRDYVEARIRAGVLEQRTADLLAESGVGGRMQREGIVHDGIELQFDGERHRIAFDELTGKSIVIYGQTEVVKDLIEARLESGRPLLSRSATSRCLTWKPTGRGSRSPTRARGRSSNAT